MRLRTSIEVSEHEGGLKVRDAATGLELVLGADAGPLVAQLLQAGEEHVSTGDAEVADFYERLTAIGLSRDLPEPEAVTRQGAFVLAQTAERELPSVVATLRHAVTVSSFHRARLSPLLDTVHGVEDLERLPLMTKDDLRANFPEGLVQLDVMKAGLDTGELLFATTSGTTGDRLQVVSDTRLPRFPPDFLTSWDVGAFEPGVVPRTAVFTSPVCAGPICHLGRVPMAERIVSGATLYLNSSDDIFSLDRELGGNVLDELEAFDPHFLFVNPVYLAVLVARAQEWGRTLPRPRAIVSCYQYLSRCQRKVLSAAFGCPIYDLYSATDLGGAIIANTCRYGSLHVRLDQVFVELVRDGRGVAPGELGRIAVTSHHPIMPLVRYVVGDVGRWEGTPCRCGLGSQSPRLTVEGRARDVLRVGTKLVTARDVDEALAVVDGIGFYQLVETAPGEFTLTLVPHPVTGPAPERAAAEALAPLLGRAPAIRVARRLRAERGQKFRLTVPAGDPALP